MDRLGARRLRARGYKKMFMLNSAKHEILNAHEYKTIKKFSFFFRFRLAENAFFPTQRC